MMIHHREPHHTQAGIHYTTCVDWMLLWWFLLSI